MKAKMVNTKPMKYAYKEVPNDAQIYESAEYVKNYHLKIHHEDNFRRDVTLDAYMVLRRGEIEVVENFSFGKGIEISVYRMPKSQWEISIRIYKPSLFGE